MRHRLITAAAVSAALTLAACTSGSTGPPPPFATLTPTVSATPSGDLPSGASPIATNPEPTQVHDPGDVTGTLAGKTCHATGAPPYELPDPACTPGSYDPSITAAILCSPSYRTGPYRPSSSETTRFKYRQAYPAYGLPATAPAELDHLISLQLGGSNDATNLWPEPPPSPNPKDATEGRLHAWICAKGIPAAQAQGRLESAQQAIASSWITAEQVLGVPGAPPLPSAPASGNGDD
jgi:hypothetical protein